jgi:hypothetical protein
MGESAIRARPEQYFFWGGLIAPVIGGVIIFGEGLMCGSDEIAAASFSASPEPGEKFERHA